MFADAWLGRWLPLIKQRAGKRPVLEIGCGFGDDTAALAAAGLSVIGFDLSRSAVAIARLRVASARLECRDIRDPLPECAVRLGVIVASLSLHYFPWDETVRIVDRVRAALAEGGIRMSPELNGRPTLRRSEFSSTGTRHLRSRWSDEAVL